MRLIKAFTGKICLFIIIFIWASPAKPQNLILNPGCEDSLVNGEIPNWTEVQGNDWKQRTASPDPFEGSAYFFAGVSATAELQQDVDVSTYASTIDDSTQVFTFEGYVHSYPQTPSDQSRIILEFFNASKTNKIDSIDYGNYSNTSEWVQITDSSIVRPGTRHIRIRLISTRRAGSNNDGYYDGLSLLLPSTATNIISDIPKFPDRFQLHQNYPNPFNPSTVISYQLAVRSHVTLKVFDILGREISTLVNREKPAGHYQVTFNASGLPSGMYLYILRTNSFVQTKKMLLIQ